MAYVNPANRSAGELITAARWNQDVVANIQYLKSPPATILEGVDNTTSSTSYVPLTETKNIITTSGGRVLIGAYGWSWRESGPGPMQVTLGLQIDGGAVGNAIIVTLPDNLTNGVPWAMLHLTAQLAPAFHTFRLYHRVNGFTGKTVVRQFWLLEV